MYHSTRQFRQMPALQGDTQHDDDGHVLFLPKVPARKYEFAVACRRRFSPGSDFISSGISQQEVAAILSVTTSTCRDVSDVDARTHPREPRVSIAACVHGVAGLQDGAYLYDSRLHGLRLIRGGDYPQQLQQTMSMPTVNLFQSPLCFHLVGPRDSYLHTFGYRGYRIQQMEVGMLLQRLLLSVSALGMAGHPLLDYDEGLCDNIYDIGRRGKTCLIQVPVGFYRKMSRFEGPLYG